MDGIKMKKNEIKYFLALDKTGSNLKQNDPFNANIRPEFILLDKNEEYAKLLNNDCKNAYTASVYYTSDHPNAKNLTLSNLLDSGYVPSKGVTTILNNFSNKGGTITCSGPDEWQVSPAVINANGTTIPSEAKAR